MQTQIKYFGQSRRKPPFLGGLSFAVAASLNKFRRSGGETRTDRIDCLDGSASGVAGNDEARKVTAGVRFSQTTVETHRLRSLCLTQGGKGKSSDMQIFYGYSGDAFQRSLCLTDGDASRAATI
ncbi:hypothetical protein [Kozakia baliensis]|uniref:hypothetical protein n=1 Tax=Kozakia baliensis TaxID=153496 RepID=UPI001267D31A|nr:hypothetical protein [Kozakia baliensis]